MRDNDGDGYAAGPDCVDDNVAIHPDAAEIPDNDTDENCDGVKAVNLDRDADGYARSQDCNDGNPAIHPNAVDVPGNGIDENCDGVQALVRITSPIENYWRTAAGRTTVVLLRARHIPKGGKMTVTCSGHGCAFRRVTPRVKRNRADATKAFRKRKLRAGAIVEVRITRDGMIGKVVRYTMRRGNRLPRTAALCLPPSTARPAPCS